MLNFESIQKNAHESLVKSYSVLPASKLSEILTEKKEGFQFLSSIQKEKELKFINALEEVILFKLVQNRDIA